MQSVAKFVTKAYLVSGSFDHLKEVSVVFPDHETGAAVKLQKHI